MSEDPKSPQTTEIDPKPETNSPEMPENLPQPCKIMKCVKLKNSRENFIKNLDLVDQKKKQNLEKKLLKEKESEFKKIYNLEREQLRIELKKAQLEEKERRQSENLEKTRKRLEKQRRLLEEKSAKKIQKEQEESEKKSNLEIQNRKKMKEREFFKSFFTNVKKSSNSPAKSVHWLLSIPDPNMKVIQRAVENFENFDILIRANSEIGALSYKPAKIHFPIPRENHPYKFLKFHDSNRPSYYGTWRKTSKILNGRRPLRRDETLFDYEADSDWEEDGSGENLTGSEDEVDDEDGEEVEDDGFLVPEGYLSEDEGGDGCGVSFGWVNALNKVVIGCVWEGGESSDVLDKFKIVDIPPLSETPEVKQTLSKKPVPEEAMEHLIRLCHGNVHRMQSLITEFQLFWIKHRGVILDPLKIRLLSSNPSEINSMSPISRRQLELRMTQISSYEKREDKKRWYVKDDVLKQYGLGDLPAANKWEYLTIKTDG